MTRFAKRISLFAATVALVFAVYARVFIGGEDSNFYRRFTSPPAPSLVVGSSRCAQGIVPAVINESELQFARPLYNYCFTNGNSPYGPYYLESIKNKLERGSNGLFLVEVNPWTLSVREKGISKNKFREANRFIAEMEIVNNINPNLEYVIKRYNKTHYRTILNDVLGREGHSFLKKSGWLRITVDMSKKKVEKRIKRKIKSYREIAEKWSLSAKRIGYFGETVSFLNEHGRVFVVRMPVSKEMLELEQTYAPTFDSTVDSVVTASGGTYLDCSEDSGQYQTTDGNHLWQNDARRFTRTMIDSLK
jgi:hypothetical protein